MPTLISWLSRQFSSIYKRTGDSVSPWISLALICWHLTQIHFCRMSTDPCPQQPWSSRGQKSKFGIVDLQAAATTRLPNSQILRWMKVCFACNWSTSINGRCLDQTVSPLNLCSLIVIWKVFLSFSKGTWQVGWRAWYKRTRTHTALQIE